MGSDDRPRDDSGAGDGWRRAATSGDVGRFLAPADLPDVDILVGRLIGGEVVAVSRVCPHRGRRMDGGAVYTDEIVCPHHHYTYDARTGENRYPKNVFPAERAKHIGDIAVFPARDDGEWIWVRA